MPDQTPETTELMVDALRLAYTRIFNHRIDHLRSAETIDKLDQEALEVIDTAIKAATGSRYDRPGSLSEYKRTALERAAPQLLEAAREIWAAYEPYYVSAMADDSERTAVDEAIDGIRCAIHTATGENTYYA